MAEGVHIWLMITRGKKKTPFQVLRFSIYGPTIVIILEFKTASDATINRGITLFTVDVHRSAPDVQDPKLNSYSKLNCAVALIEAIKAVAPTRS